MTIQVYKNKLIFFCGILSLILGYPAAYGQANVTFDYETGVTGYASRTVKQTKSGSTLVAVADLISFGDPRAGYLTLNGSGSLVTDFNFGLEKKITLSLASGAAFDLASFKILNYNLYNQSLVFTTSKGTTNYLVPAGNPSQIPVSVNLTGVTGYSNLQGITSVQITVNDPGNNLFAFGFDDFTLQNITAAATATTVTSITRADASPTKAGTVNFTVTFATAVTGVDVSDFTLDTGAGITSATLGTPTGSGTTWTVPVNNVNGNGTLSIDFTGLTGVSPNVSSAFTAGEAYTIDRTAPTVTSITRVDASPTSAATVNYKVTFSEKVSGVDVSDFNILFSGTVAATAGAPTTNDNINYNVPVNITAYGGQLRLDLRISGTGISDAAGNVIATGFSSGQTYSVSLPVAAPTVSTFPGSGITVSGATLNGSVTADGGASLSGRGFVYSSTNSSPSIGGNDVTAVAEGGTGTGVFFKAVTGLSPGATYYVAAYATNSAGTAYGTPVSLTTLAPAIAVNGVLTAFTTTSGIASAAQSFGVGGSNLTAGIVVTAPSGFELSASAGGTYSTSLTLTPTSGAVASTMIYARLASTATGSLSGNITLTSANATTRNIGISGSVTGLNRAPVLADKDIILRISPTQPSVPSFDGAGTLLSEIINTTGIGNFSDADSGTSPGIAITGIDVTRGTLWYTADDGISWTTMSAGGGISATKALLLKADAFTRIYFGPSSSTFTGTISPVITFRAWDQTSGIAGTKVDVSVNGGSSAFSAATDMASLIIAFPATITQSGTLTAFTTISGTASAAQSFTVSGLILSADITITAPTGYEVSLTAASGYANTLTLSQTSGTVASTTLYVRLASTATGTPSGNISLSSTGAATQVVAVSGTVISASGPPVITSFSPAAAPPTSIVKITGINFNNTAANNIVYFGAAKATVTAATSTSLTLTVPNGSTYAPINVVNTGTGLQASSTKFFSPIQSTKYTLGTGDFASKVTVNTSTSGSEQRAVLYDLDGDGKPDIMFAGYANNSVTILKNNTTPGNITPASFSLSKLTAGTNARYIAVGDLDGDGKPDIAVTNYLAANLSVFRNTSTPGNLSFTTQIVVNNASLNRPNGLAIADIDGDGKPELIVSNQTGGTLSLLQNNSISGTIAFAAPVTFPIGSSPYSVKAADMDGDGKPDIIAVNYSSNSVSVLKNTATAGTINSSSLASYVAFAVGAGPRHADVADFDNDGKLDIAVTNATDATVSILRNETAGTAINASSFSTAATLSTLSNPWPVIAGDLDGDGKPDLLIGHTSSNSNISVIHNIFSGTLGPGSFETRLDLPTTTGLGSHGPIIGDIDGDGVPDIVVPNGIFSGDGSLDIFRNTLIAGPITNASSLAFTNVTTSGATISWTNGNGSARAVFIKAAASGTASPVNGVAYTADPVFSSGTQIGTSGWYCIYNGSGTSVSVSGLSAGTAYQTAVFEYTKPESTELYSVAYGLNNPAGFTTLSGPSIAATASLAAFASCAGSASTPQSFTVSGDGLGTNALTVTPPTGFELSTTQNGTYASTISLSPVSGAVAATTIYVRMASAASSPAAGNITVASSGATSQTIAVSGTVNTVPAITLGTVNTVFTISTSFSVPYTAATGTPSQYSITAGNRALAGFTAVSNATLGSSPITVNIPASAAGTYDFNLTVNTATCTSVVVPFTLTIAVPSPTIATTGSLAALTSTFGTASAAGTFNVSGNFMTSGILVTAPAGFELSLSTSSGFASSVTVGSAGSIASTPVYVRLIATDVPANYSGNITLKSTGASDVNVATVSSTVSPAPLTITANNAGKTYGTSLTANGPGSTAYTISSGSLQNGNTLSSVTITYATSSGAAATDAAGTYTGTIMPSLATGADGFVSSNYHITYANGNITVNKAPLTITATGPAKAFGTALTAGTSTSDFTASATVNGESVTGVTLTPNAAGLSANTAVGLPYVVTPSAATGTNGFLASNYNITYVPYNGTVINATPTISTSGTLAALTATYGSASASGTLNISGINITGGILVTAPMGFEVSLNGSSGFGSTVTVPGTGTVAATPVFVRLSATNAAASYSGNVNLNSAGAANVTITVAPSNVTPKAITVTADAKTKTYGDADPVLTYTSSPALVSGDAFSGTLTRAAGENAGTYAINPGTLTLSDNYTLAYTGANLAIGTKAITVTADAKTKTYGDADPALTYTFSPALITGDSFTGGLGRTSGENVGNYSINQGSLALSANYVLSYTAKNLDISAKAIAVTADAKTKIYGDADPVLTYTFTPALISGDVFSGSLSRVAGENVGNYSINQGTLALSANYVLNYTAKNLGIGAKAIAITADAKTKIYGDADPALTYTFSPALISGDSFSGSLGRVAGESVNAYAINRGTLVLNSNYSLTYTSALFTITKKALTITAANQSKVYGSANPIFSVIYAGFAGTDNASSLTAQPTVNSTAGTGSAVGTYPITVNAAQSGNYAITYIAGTLTVSPAVLMIAAANQTRLYGAANPVLTVSYTGFVNGDLPANLSAAPAVSTTATTTSGVGSYAITASGAQSNNYTISYAPGILTVNPALLTLTAVNQNKVYGAVNPALTVTYSGFVNGENASNLTVLPGIATTAVTGSAAGAYPITAGGAASANYTINYVAGTLTVAKAALTITADNKSRLFGAANPVFTTSFSGLVNGDTPASFGSMPTISTNATANSAPGNYPVSLSGATSPNYNISYVPGVLTVIPLSIADLLDLRISSGKLSPSFTTATRAYADSVVYTTDRISLVPTIHPTATVTINGVNVSNGSSSGDIQLNTGFNNISIVVTAQDGVTRLTYTVRVYKGIPADMVSGTNILTPNGDGENDTWVIKDILLYPDNNVTVYDRGGRVVFSKHGYTNTWDGTLRGAPLAEGTYYYIVDLGVGVPAFKGFITILRNR